MAVTREYATRELSRSETDAFACPMLLEFGSPWCGYCRRAQPLIEEAFADHPACPPHQDRRCEPAAARGLHRREALADARVPERRPRDRPPGAPQFHGCDPRCAESDRRRLRWAGAFAVPGDVRDPFHPTFT